jgi:hypothetical protein
MLEVVVGVGTIVAHLMLTEVLVVVVMVVKEMPLLAQMVLVVAVAGVGDGLILGLVV